MLKDIACRPIIGWVECGEALNFMRRRDAQGDNATFAFLLRRCGDAKALSDGRRVHAHVVWSGQDRNRFVVNLLVNMYGKCERVEDARALFDRIVLRNVFSWNIMIAAYAQNEREREALLLFRQMQLEGVKADKFTFLPILSACANMETLAEGKVIHELIISSGCNSDVAVLNALVHMYGKCGSVRNARLVFDQMHRRNVVSWTAMIAAYAQNGHGNQALELFRQMGLEGVMPNKITFLSLLDVCASLACLTNGRVFHERIAAQGFESDVVVANALVNMYGKCGSLRDAWMVFSKIPRRDVVSWNAIIAACAQIGNGKEAYALLHQMSLEGVKPNRITFLSILRACSHAGLLDVGQHSFSSMSRVHGITPTVEHYACLIDLLGRAGQLDEAEDLIKNMPIQPDAVVWLTLLGACRIHGDAARGARAAEQVFKLDSENAAPYVLLSNMHAASGRWDHVAKVRKTIGDRGVKKEPGCSWIEVEDRVHVFVGGDTSHPRWEEMNAELQRLSRQMLKAGYVPDTRAVLHDIEEASREHMLCYHSEKLAIAFGLIATLPRTSLRIVKNLRVCSDCHAASKLISNIVKREIVVRDASRFHLFNHGVCSCGDYW